VLQGCGGDPRDLLTASEVWTVTEIAGEPIVPGTEVTMSFADSGAVAGSGGCNRFTALSPPRMAHVPADLPVHLLAGIVEIVALGLAFDGGADGVLQHRVVGEARSGARRSAMSSCPRHM
jgi:hypothetical protein